MDREPALLLSRAPPDAEGSTAQTPTTERAASPRRRPASPRAPQFYAVGFWSRLLAAAIDLALIVSVGLALAWVVGKLLGFGLPPSLGSDYWLDLLAGADPSTVSLVVIVTATGVLYLLLFQLTLGQTPGMRLRKLRIIDPYGDPPASARVAIRTAGYLASAATLGLGFIWVGFDSEKRGLHDWISGTHVVRA